MKKTDPTLIHAIREYAKSHPEDSYDQIAISFGTSAINVKCICNDLRRGKDWRRGRKHANPDAAKSWTRIDKRSDGLWKGCVNESGYGFLHFNSKSQCAHRVAYELTFGAIPDGKELDHKCRDRACCNPAHLEPVTHAENMERVCSFQAKQAGQSSQPIDTRLPIDTLEKDRPEEHSDVARTLIKDDKINAEAASETGVSVSIDTDSTGLAMNAIAVHEDVKSARVPNSDVAGDAGNTSPRPSDKKQVELYFYELWSPGDGIRLTILARSEYDAESKFASVWGDEPSVRPKRMEGPVDEKVAAKWLLTQERELASEFDRWQSSEDGHRYSARAAREAEGKRQTDDSALRWGQEWDDDAVAALAEQDYLLAQAQRRLSAQSPRQRRSEYDGYYEDERGL